jgi:hypothetical protein
MSHRQTSGLTTGEVLYDGKRPSMKTVKNETAYVQQVTLTSQLIDHHLTLTLPMAAGDRFPPATQRGD